MALITCPECGQQISDRAKVCPHCGFDLNAPKCADCGAYLPEGAAACPSCGCPVEAAAPQPAPTPAPREAAKPGVAILELPGPHPKMKTAEEWVVADDAGKNVKTKIKWGDDRTVELPLTTSEPVWVMPEDQMEDKRRKAFWAKLWPVYRILAAIFGILAVVGGIGALAVFLIDLPGTGLIASIGFAVGLLMILIPLFVNCIPKVYPDPAARPVWIDKSYDLITRYYPKMLLPASGDKKRWQKIVQICLPVVVLLVFALALINFDYGGGWYRTDIWDETVAGWIAMICVMVAFLCFAFVVMPFFVIGHPVALFCHRRSKHLRLIITPGKRYNLVWRNRHTFSVSEYDA
ncbi:MAG: zinc ribbon domain-containing protein [Clostridia bacterium]|nr:zinc ribbon domain-containing protein [Clostridia bacterium]